MRIAAAYMTAWLGLVAAPAAAADLLVGVIYAPPERATADSIRGDLQRIRRAGFNAVVPSDEVTADRLTPLLSAADLRLIPTRPREGTHRERIAAGAGSVSAAAARLAFWTAIARGVQEIAFAAPGRAITPEIVALGETAGVVTRNQELFVSLRPRAGGVRSISAAGGAAVDVKLLDSAETVMIIATNRSPSPRRATIVFDPDVPEAIWQNLETGTAINFVMGKTGPVLEYAFAPRESLVLMIRKRFR